jgi:hypothetical protein
MIPSNTAVMRIPPEPVLIEGQLPARYLAAVTQWINLNREVLLGYWDGTIGTGALMRGLQTVASMDEPDT